MTEAFTALERWLDPPRGCLHALAQAYVDSSARTRRRPSPIQVRYRFPRGRSTDTVPIAAALTDRRCTRDVHLVGTVRF